MKLSDEVTDAITKHLPGVVKSGLTLLERALNITDSVLDVVGEKARRAAPRRAAPRRAAPRRAAPRRAAPRRAHTAALPRALKPCGCGLQHGPQRSSRPPLPTPTPPRAPLHSAPPRAASCGGRSSSP